MAERANRQPTCSSCGVVLDDVELHELFHEQLRQLTIALAEVLQVLDRDPADVVELPLINGTTVALDPVELTEDQRAQLRTLELERVARGVAWKGTR